MRRREENGCLVTLQMGCLAFGIAFAFIFLALVAFFLVSVEIYTNPEAYPGKSPGAKAPAVKSIEGK